MSKQGINKVAKILYDMQEVTIELLKDNDDKQDVYLAQMLEIGKNNMKHKFAKLTSI